MSVQNLSPTSPISAGLASSQVEEEVNAILSPRPEGQDLTLSQSLSPDRVQFLTPAIQKLKGKFNKLKGLIENLEFEPSPTDPQYEEKIKKREKCLIPTACVPGVGTGITVFKERELAEKIKAAITPAEKLKLLETQKKFRFSAMIRTFISVALAVTLLAVAVFTGGFSVAAGLCLIGGVIGIGSGFAGYYSTLLHDSNKKLKVFKAPT